MLVEYGGGLRGDRVCAEAALVIGGAAAFVLAFGGARSKSCAGSSCATAARTTVSLSCAEATISIGWLAAVSLWLTAAAVTAPIMLRTASFLARSRSLFCLGAAAAGDPSDGGCPAADGGCIGRISMWRPSVENLAASVT